MPAIPRMQTESREINQLQSNILTPLNALAQNPLFQGNILTEVPLITGDNVINHKLNRKLIGWFLVRKRADSDIFDNQDFNKNPNSTLILNSSAGDSDNPVVVDIYVF